MAIRRTIWRKGLPDWDEKNVGVRINDYVDFISAGHADFESEQRRFITDHGLDEKYADSNSYLAARCHVISYGYK